MNKVISIIFMVIILIFTCFFIVQEGHRGIMLRFGRVLCDSSNFPLVYEPGLHIKFPFIDKIKTFNFKIQTIENKHDSFATKEKQDIIVDSYIKWKINDFNRYYSATKGGNIIDFDMFLKQKFHDYLQFRFKNLNIQDIIINFENYLITDIKNILNIKDIGHHYSSENFNNSFKTSSRLNMHVRSNDKLLNLNCIPEAGIQIIDVRITKINFPVKTIHIIHNKMKSDFEVLTKIQKLIGQKKTEKIRARAYYRASKILSKVKRQSLIIKGEGEAIVAKLFSDVFSKDVEFYNFIRSLQAYENIFRNNHNLIIINPSSSNFFHYMKNPNKS